jgi:DNA-binding NarL/FixJ family response regulator
MVSTSLQPSSSTAPLSSHSAHEISVLIVSDVRLYCEGLAQSLNGRGRVRVVAAANCAAAALARLRVGDIQVALLDMAISDGLSLVRASVREVPNTRVVAYALVEVPSNVLACAEAGVDGYVPSDGSLADLVQAIESVSRGETVCSSAMAGPLFRQLAKRPIASSELPSALTAREREIADLLDGGLSNKAIGAQLHIELATVKQHVHNILDKLHVSGRAEAVAALRTHTPRTLEARHIRETPARR